jgi:hypothetical protein
MLARKGREGEERGGEDEPMMPQRHSKRGKVAIVGVVVGDGEVVWML